MSKIIGSTFYLVCERYLIDVEKRVVVMDAGVDIEANGVQIFNVYHDPQISLDKLTMKHREAPHYVEPRVNIPNFDPDAETIFYSKDRKKLFEFNFNWQGRADGRLTMLLEFSRPLSLIIESLGPHVGGGVVNYLQRIVSTAFDIHDVPSGTSGVAELALFARRDIADILYPAQATVEAGGAVLLFTKRVA